MLLKGAFYTCSLFSELYDQPGNYGPTEDLMDRSLFMALKRDLAGVPMPADDQRALNRSFQFETGEDRTGDLRPREKLLLALAASYVPVRLSS